MKRSSRPTAVRVLAPMAALPCLAACESIWLPSPDGRIVRVGLSETARCEAIDEERLHCVSECAAGGAGKGDPRAEGDCNNACATRHRPCSARMPYDPSPARKAPASRPIGINPGR